MQTRLARPVWGKNALWLLYFLIFRSRELFKIDFGLVIECGIPWAGDLVSSLSHNNFCFTISKRYINAATDSD